MENKFKGLVLSALFAAIICACSFIIIPLPVGLPIVLQDMMSMLSGLILGPLYGTIAVAVFLILGCIGLPVFSGKGGLHILTEGPTGGFLTGYMTAALIGGLILAVFLNKNKEHSELKQYAVIAIAAFIATLICFGLGIAGFMRVTHKTAAESFFLVVLPFIPGNIIKLVIMVPLTKRFRKITATA